MTDDSVSNPHAGQDGGPDFGFSASTYIMLNGCSIPTCGPSMRETETGTLGANWVPRLAESTGSEFKQGTLCQYIRLYVIEEGS